MKRIIATLMLLMGMVMTPALTAAAQPEITDQTWISELTGDEIDLGTSGEVQFIPEDFEVNETASFQEEFIWFTYGWSNFELILVSGPTTTEEYHELTLGNMHDFYDSFDVIDEEVTDEHSWFFGAGEFQGTPLVVYYEFDLDAYGDIDQVLMQFSDPTTFASDLEFVQGEVTIAGGPLLPNTDAQELASLVGNESDVTTPESDDDGEANGRSSQSSNTGDDDDTVATGRTSRSSGTEDDDEDDNTGVTGRTSRSSGTEDDDEVSTPESDDDGTSGRTSRSGNTSEVDDDKDDTGTTGRTSRASSTDDEGDDQPDRQSRTGRVGDTETDDDDVTSTPAGGDWESMGLISDSEWQSPTFGSVFTWDPVTWEFPLDYETAIYISEDPAYDVVTLQTTDGLGYVYMTVEEQGESTPRSLADFWTTPEYADRFEQEITVVDTASTANTASVVYETTNTRDQSLFVVVEATFLDDGTVVFSQISAAPDTIADVYGQFSDGIEIDGASIDMTWTIEDVEELSGN